jgi:hypothetical protein
MTTTYYRDASNRSVSDEDIALRWIREHPNEAARAIRAGRGAPEPRPFVIHGKATPDGKVAIHPAHRDDDLPDDSG